MDPASVFVRGVWRMIPSEEDTAWVDRVARLPADDSPCGDYGALVRRMLGAGLTREEIARFARIVGYEVAHGLCYHLGDPNASYEGFADVAPAYKWGLFQLEKGGAAAAISGLHEILLTADPSGREMRPKGHGKAMQYTLRTATLDDRPELERLIARSARELSARDYTPEQIEGALKGAFGVDSQLIRDGTYFVAVRAGVIIGCGGWGRRKTMFGGDAFSDREPEELDPRTDAARIRAFFVDPDCARQGIGRAILHRCESEARARGFTRFELMGTLPGVRLYEAEGYVAAPSIEHPLGEGLTIRFVPMSKG
jgi:GNAT superfamily N-acetyltransferase